MKKLFMILSILLTLAAAAFAYTVHCAAHDYAVCSPAGYEFIGIHEFQRYHCSCGDDVLVRVY